MRKVDHPRTGEYPIVRRSRLHRVGGEATGLGDDLLFGTPDAPRSTISVLLLEADQDDAAHVEAALAGVSRDAEGARRYVVTWRSRIEDGVAALATGLPDVVLMDEALSEANGVPGLTLLQEAAPTVPIVVLTTRDSDAAASATIRAGAQDYLCKARATPELLERAIRYAIERKRAELAIRRAQWLAGIGETALALQHEVNNPLAVLIAHAEFLERGGTPEENAESVTEMVLAAERIAAIVQHIAQLGEPRSVVSPHGRRMLDLRDRKAESA